MIHVELALPTGSLDFPFPRLTSQSVMTSTSYHKKRHHQHSLKNSSQITQKDHYLFSCAAERGSKPIVSVAESFIDFALVISSNFQRTLLVVMTSTFANLFGGRRCVMFCFDTQNFTFSRFTLVRTVQIQESIRGKNCNTINKYNGYGTLSNLIHKN